MEYNSTSPEPSSEVCLLSITEQSNSISKENEARRRCEEALGEYDIYDPNLDQDEVRTLIDSKSHFVQVEPEKYWCVICTIFKGHSHGYKRVESVSKHYRRTHEGDGAKEATAKFNPKGG